jgi:hypothetical protein
MAIEIDPECNAIAAHHRQVRRKLKRVADGIARRASAKLAAHHHSGDAEITRTSGALDEFVNLEDKRRRGGPAAAAIEFGHVARNGRIVPGIYVLTGSLP